VDLILRKARAKSLKPAADGQALQNEFRLEHFLFAVANRSRFFHVDAKQGLRGEYQPFFGIGRKFRRRRVGRRSCVELWVMSVRNPLFR
jgi:hypothetical protein